MNVRRLLGLALTLASAAQTAQAGYKHYLVGAAGLPIPGDADAFRDGLLRAFGGTVPESVDSKLVLTVGMPERYIASGTRYTRVRSFQIDGTNVYLYLDAVKAASEGVEVYQAFAIQDNDTEWLWDSFVQGLGVGKGATKMIEALFDRVRPDQGFEVAQWASRFFKAGLIPQFLSVEEDDPVVQAFLRDLAAMDTSTGALTFKNRSEGAELAERALGLLRSGATAAGVTIQTTGGEGRVYGVGQ